MNGAPASFNGLKGASWLALLVTLVVLCAPHLAQAQTVCAIPGKDGAATLNGVVNTYHPGSGTASAGATSITVGSSRIGGASIPISAGDLLLVIQIQDADINASSTASYGDGSGGNTGSGWNALNNTGLYEYVMATNSIGLIGGTITIRGTGASNGLRNTYTTAAPTSTSGQKRFQVVRVPQYSTATLSSVTAAPWDGSTGGIVAFDVAGGLTITGGTVNVTGLGFRGGGTRQLKGDTSAPATDYRLPSTYNVHGSKGEGIAGTPHYVYNAQTGLIDNTGAEGYPNGDHMRGAPGNAGGGGNDADLAQNQKNSGGGGGSNGGAGGRGGNSWSDNTAVGGYGGASFAASAATNRIVFGGGGGGGTKNNDDGITAASTGAAGGGIVMIRAGSVTGAGTINANGSDAFNNTDNDGGGGGGAGGSVIVMSASGLGGFTINVNGGRGGDAWHGQAANGTPGERHGPGGGGGGGIVYYSNIGGTPTVNRNGGAFGITTTSNDNYGATAGGNGPVPANITFTSTLGASPSYQCIPALTTTKTTSTASVTNSSSGTTATYTITVVNAANLGSAIQVNISDLLPANFTYASTSSVNPTNGATRDSISNPTAGATNPSWGVFSIPGSGQVQITFTVNISQSVLSGTYQNPATTTYLDPVRTLANPNNTVISSYNSASSTGEDVTVTSIADMTIAKTHTGNFTQGQTNATYTLTATNSGSGQTSGTVTVTDTLPAGLTPTGVSAAAPWSCGISTQTVTCTRSDALVAPNSYSAITITVSVSATAPASITNTATVSGGGETNVSNNSASDATTINQLPDMTVAKTHTGNFTRGGVGNYTITATNSGATVTNGTTVTVTDTLPAGLTPTGFSTAVGWTCNIASQTVTCTRTDVLGAGVSYPVIGVNVSVAQNAAASLTNTASISGGGQVNTANDSANDATTIVSSSDLSLAKVTNNSGSGVGSNATFTVTLTNSGPTNATNVTVRDQLPAGLTYVSSTPSVGAYNSGTGVWTVAALSSGTSATLQIVARIDVVGTLTNTAQVTASDQPDPDSTPNNNNAAEDDQASSSLTTSPPNLVLCKTLVGQPCPPGALPTQAPGTDIPYLVNFTNTGGSPASSLVITDPYIDPALPVASRPKLNAYTYFKLGSLGNTLPAGLTLTSVKYSNDSGQTWGYTPVSGGGGAPAGYDANVTHIQWTFGGSLSQSAPNNTGSINFTVRIK